MARIRGRSAAVRLIASRLRLLPSEIQRELELLGRDAALRTDPATVYTVGIHGHPRPPIFVSSGGRDATVTAGNYTSINPTAAFFLGGLHRDDWVTTNRLRQHLGVAGPLEDDSSHTNGDITVGSDVWIAQEAMIMSGVTIGHGAVVGARAVVTKDVEPYQVVAGIPAKPLRWRFDEPTREALLRIAWWDWPESKVRTHVDELCSDNLSGFVQRHDQAASA